MASLTNPALVLVDCIEECVAHTSFTRAPGYPTRGAAQLVVGGATFVLLPDLDDGSVTVINPVGVLTRCWATGSVQRAVDTYQAERTQ